MQKKKVFIYEWVVIIFCLNVVSSTYSQLFFVIIKYNDVTTATFINLIIFLISLFTVTWSRVVCFGVWRFTI